MWDVQGKNERVRATGNSSGPTEASELNGRQMPQCQTDLWLENGRKSCRRIVGPHNQTPGTNDSQRMATFRHPKSGPVAGIWPLLTPEMQTSAASHEALPWCRVDLG